MPLVVRNRFSTCKSWDEIAILHTEIMKKEVSTYEQVVNGIVHNGHDLFIFSYVENDTMKSLSTRGPSQYKDVVLPV